MIDKAKFDQLPFHKQVKMFREEVAVIALERWILNPKCDAHWVKAWQYALRKTVCYLTKGWASDFMVRNIEHFDKPKWEDFKYTIEKLGGKDMGVQVDFKKLVEEIGEKINQEFGEEIYGGCCEITHGWVKVEGYELVEQDGGGEGGSEYCYSIIKWNDVYYKIEYSYYSHYGYNFDDATATIVQPKTKQVTVYE